MLSNLVPESMPFATQSPYTALEPFVLSTISSYIRFKLGKLQSSAVDLDDLGGLGRLGVLIGSRTGLDRRV
jgi:hypothetical protein